jgi:hypothetical protein
VADEMHDKRLAERAKFIVTNPMVRRGYFTDPLNVLARMIPGDELLQAELASRVEDAIAKDPKLVSQRDEHVRAYRPARLIAHNPRLRTEYFENPRKALARAIPRRGLLERISLAVPERARVLRVELGDRVEAIISSDSRLISGRETTLEKNVFLNEALQNPQRTFIAIVVLSILAFLVSASLVVGAFLAALFGDGTTEKALLGGLSGGRWRGHDSGHLSRDHKRQDSESQRR